MGINRVSVNGEIEMLVKKNEENKGKFSVLSEQCKSMRKHRHLHVV